MDFRQIKHDLRTPVNHIVGYGELALEFARDESDTVAAQYFEQLVTGARKLASSIAGQLSGEFTDEGAADRLESLKALLRPQLDFIEHLAAGAGGAFDVSAYETDLGRIRAAVLRLRDFDIGCGTTPVAELAQVQAGKAGAEYVLIVDDDPANRDVLQRMLQSDGYRLACAGTGEEGLKKLAAEQFDLVLLDMMMPGIDGYEVLQRMQAAPRMRDIPAIMISALDDLSSVVRCIQAGAEDYLSKPFEPVLLRARIGASLSKRRLRKQIVAQERLASLGSITAGVAHEIKNPLNFIVNFAELSRELATELKEGPPDADLSDMLEQNLSKILEHAKRADSIVAGMLLHARSGQAEREQADLNNLVKESVHLARHGTAWTANCDQLEVSTNFDPRSPAVECIPSDLARVFLNLTNNAIYSALEKHRQQSGAPARVEITTRSKDGWAEVRIRDNGFGVPPELKDKIFQPFFTTKPTGSGTGLGLSISFDVVTNAHGGEILVDSQPGSYAEFIVRVPRR